MVKTNYGTIDPEVFRRLFYLGLITPEGKLIPSKPYIPEVEDIEFEEIKTKQISETTLTR